MSSHIDALSEIQRLLKTIPEEREIISKIHQMEEECYKGIDANATRAAVLIATGFLEHGLAVAIGAFFINDRVLRQKLFDGDHEREGVIGTIYTQNIVAHALDIYGSKTYNDVNSIRLIRNLCAHAKSEVDFSSNKLKPLSKFHATEAITEAISVSLGYGTPKKRTPPRLTSQSPAHGLLQFLQHFLPYLLLHGSPGYLTGKNRADWRATFA